MGYGIEKENEILKIYFNVGIFTIRDVYLQREELEKIISTIKFELEKELLPFRIEIYPIVDQPQDSVFIIENVITRKTNPDIQTKLNYDSYQFLNPF